MATVFFRPKEVALLEALNRHGVKFIVVGLSSAVLQGVHVSTQDIALWVDDLGSESFLAAVDKPR